MNTYFRVKTCPNIIKSNAFNMKYFTLQFISMGNRENHTKKRIINRYKIKLA